MMHDDAASQVGPPTQGTQGEGPRAEPQSSEAAQALVASVDGSAPSARRLVARDGHVVIEYVAEYVEPPDPTAFVAFVERQRRELLDALMRDVREFYGDAR